MNRPLLATLLLLSVTAASHASSIPYFQDFQSIPAAGALPGSTIGVVTATTNTWAVAVDGSGHHTYQNTLASTNGAKGFSSLQFSNLGPATSANNFEMSAELTPVSDSVGTVNYTAGLRFLAGSGTVTDDSYVADLNFGASGGRIRLVEWTGTTAVVIPSSTQSNQPLVSNFALGNDYLLDVLGTYDLAGTLTINFTVTQVGAPANTQSLSFVDTTPRTGQFFGFYDSSGSGGGTQVVTFDNLTIVPEPSSLGLLAGGLLVLHRRRRGTGILAV